MFIDDATRDALLSKHGSKLREQSLSSSHPESLHLDETAREHRHSAAPHTDLGQMTFGYLAAPTNGRTSVTSRSKQARPRGPGGTMQ